MELVRFIKKTPLPKCSEMTIDLMISEMTGVKKLRPGMLENLVESCILRPSNDSG